VRPPIIRVGGDILLIDAVVATDGALVLGAESELIAVNDIGCIARIADQVPVDRDGPRIGSKQDEQASAALQKRFQIDCCISSAYRP